MSKYNDDEINKYDVNYITAWTNVLIANELAEANRLKRIEITKYCTINHHGNSKELEDQAI